MVRCTGAHLQMMETSVRLFRLKTEDVSTVQVVGEVEKVVFEAPTGIKQLIFSSRHRRQPLATFFLVELIAIVRGPPTSKGAPAGRHSSRFSPRSVSRT